MLFFTFSVHRRVKGTFARTIATLNYLLRSWIGRYKVLQQIGEGGCGIVCVAEQEEPIRRNRGRRRLDSRGWRRVEDAIKRLEFLTNHINIPRTQ